MEGSTQLDWQKIHLSEDEASAEGVRAIQFLVQQVEKARNNPLLRPILNNLMMAHVLRLMDYETPAQIPPIQEVPSGGHGGNVHLPPPEREDHSQDDSSSRRSSSPLRKPRRPLERESNLPRQGHFQRMQGSEGKRRRSPSREVSSSPLERGRKRERDRRSRKSYKTRRTPSPSDSPSSGSSPSSPSSSSDGTSSPIRGKRKRHDSYHAWKRSRKLQKFHEGGKSITFHTYDGSYDATDKVLSFIQQFDAAFGGEDFMESSKLHHVAMHFTKAARQWWASLKTQYTHPRTWKLCRTAIMKQFLTEDAKDEPVELWTGKQLFSVLIRPNAKTRVFVSLVVVEKNYRKKGGETMCPNDGYVYFRNSELISGQLGKGVLGNGNKNGLFTVLLRYYSSHAAATCMNRLAKLSARWIGNHGFSIGIDDVQPGAILSARKEGRIREGYSSCDMHIDLFNKGKLALQPGCDLVQTLEAEVCLEELHWRNSPLIMSQCGSKGSPINISQMIACVGQQAVGGKSAPIGAKLVSDKDLKAARIVKARIEKTVLGCKKLRPGQALISIKLDIRRIEALQLDISSYTIADSILRTPKLKLKQQHLRILDHSKLVILPTEPDRKKLHFALFNLRNMLPKVIVKGIPTVERAVISQDKGIYNLLVEGTNLAAAMGTDGIDGLNTRSNHVSEAEHTLGIEAARKCIIDEIQYTMASHGMSIDIRHMMLLADVMTYKGEVLGITRFGIAKMKDSVLMLASFEKTTDRLFDAAVHGRLDQIEGVSECIIMGIPMPIGTGLLKIRQKVDTLPKLEYGPPTLLS
ncbi:hypothetical protein L7F22_033762 [Adiantum nelumboides]|nr:hypothetical protein [Adiantum nelumboides]